MSDEESAPTAQSKGGEARARSLPPERRSEIAKSAAEIRWARARGDGQLLQATHYGDLFIGRSALSCAVLEDGTRVIAQNTFVRAMGRRGNLKRDRREIEQQAEVFQPPEFLAAENLKPYLPHDLRSTSTPILYLGKKGGGRPGGVNVGYRAELLPIVCQVYQDARDAGKLLPSQQNIAEACKILYRGFATVGIVALVDEATGYQEVRDRLALQAILDAYLRQEFAAWAKRFPDEYFHEIFRLKGWTWDELKKKAGKGQGPRVIGKYTNDIVYSRLAPGVLDELQRINPPNDTGHRKAKHHQFFTEEVGHPALAQHVSNVVTLLKASETWDDFLRLLNRAIPRKMSLKDLPLFNQDGEPKAT